MRERYYLQYRLIEGGFWFTHNWYPNQDTARQWGKVGTAGMGWIATRVLNETDYHASNANQRKRAI